MVDQNSHCTVIEVSFLYKVSTEHLRQQQEEKTSKYKRSIKHELDQMECRAGEVVSIVIG